MYSFEEGVLNEVCPVLKCIMGVPENLENSRGHFGDIVDL